MSWRGLYKVRRVQRVTGIVCLYGVRLLWARPRRGGLREEGPERFKNMLEDLGGTYTKFGQVLALQPDALPIEYCNTLFDLMDRVPSFPYEFARNIVRNFVAGLSNRARVRDVVQRPDVFIEP